jgi:branched-chain amino acid transport system substrate-binding protein
VTIYVSMPLRGSSGTDGRDVVDGARMALGAAGGRASKLAVRARYLDDTAGAGRAAAWSAAAVGANARTATEDTTAVAYIGDFESGASRTSEPITNAAHLLQVSPASTATDLTRPFLGSDQLPAVEDQGGERTFGRVIPDDSVQAVAGADWTRKLEVRRVQIASDGSAYGRTVSTAYREALHGVTVSRGQLVYYAGLSRGEPAAVSAADGGVMGTDALLPPFDPGGPPPVSYVTSAAQDPSQLPPAGRRFADAFARRYGHRPGRYAAYGYEAMAIVLDSIRRAGSSGDQRQAVVDSFFDSRRRHTVLGTYEINPLGDTSLDRISGYRVVGGRATPETLLRAR